MYNMNYMYNYPQYGSSHNLGNPTDYWVDNRNTLRDSRPNPFVIHINEAPKQNNTYRTAL